MKTIASVIAVLAVSVSASFAAPNALLKLGGKKFGDGTKFTAQSQGTISPSKIFTYKLQGTVTGGGPIAKLAPSGTNITKFLDSIEPGSSAQLSGSFANPSGKLPVEFINKKISGSKKVAGVGVVSVKATITGGADASGKVYLSVSKVKVTANGASVPGFIKFDKGAALTVDTAAIVSLNAAVQFVSEEAGSIKVLVNRTGNLKGTASVNYATTPGTADISDYTPAVGTLTFANGEKQKTISIPIISNTENDSSRQFSISISSPGAGVVLGTKLTNNITITDDD